MRTPGVVIALCAAAGLLSSCYTNVNQLWLQGRREYEVSQFDYYADPAAGIKGLPPLLYKCGDDWYIAARYMRLTDAYPYNCVQWVSATYAERHGFEGDAAAPVYYHKITAEMAAMLRRSDQASWEWFSKRKMQQELAKAGGEWLPALPAGAQAHPAIFLKYCRRELLVAEERTASLPWYTYPAVGLTFVCVDVPASAVSLTLGMLYGMGVSFMDITFVGAGDADDDLGGMPVPEKAVRRDGRPAHRHRGSAHAPADGRKRHPHHHRSGSEHHHHSGNSDHHGRHHHSTDSHHDKRHDKRRHRSDDDRAPNEQ